MVVMNCYLFVSSILCSIYLGHGCKIYFSHYVKRKETNESIMQN